VILKHSSQHDVVIEEAVPLPSGPKLEPDFATDLSCLDHTFFNPMASSMLSFAERTQLDLFLFFGVNGNSKNPSNSVLLQIQEIIAKLRSYVDLFKSEQEQFEPYTAYIELIQIQNKIRNICRNPCAVVPTVQTEARRVYCADDEVDELSSDSDEDDDRYFVKENTKEDKKNSRIPKKNGVVSASTPSRGSHKRR